MADTEHDRVAILWRGDHEARRNATPGNNRYHRIFEELAALGIHTEPAVYSDDLVDEARQQLLASLRGGKGGFRRHSGGVGGAAEAEMIAVR